MAEKNVILKNIMGDVLHPEIANNSVTTDKIVEGAVTKEKLDPEVLSSKADNGIMIDIVNIGTEAGIPVWKAVDDIPNRDIQNAFRKGVPVNFVIRDGYDYDHGSGNSMDHLIPVYYMYFQPNNSSIELRAKSEEYIIYKHPIASSDYSKLGYITQNRWFVGKDLVMSNDIQNKAVTKDKLADNAVTIEKLSKDVFNNITLISWSDLKILRNSMQLIPGYQYRITDYQCTTTQENTQSARHQFDIIVTADSTNKLNEKARACLHDGDTYFENSNLAAWQLWYCLDNDTNRFTWADDSLGRGVIYRMIDEFNNDCPYDFKNIQFKRYKITSSNSSGLIGTYLAIEAISDIGLEIDNNDSKMFYTFSYLGVLNTLARVSTEILEDASIIGNTLSPYGVHSNTIKYYFDSNIESSKPIQSLNNIVFLTYSSDNMYNGCYSNSFDINNYNSSFSDSCYNNSFGDGCQYNLFGNQCYNNSFGDGCEINSFGNQCMINSFGYGCAISSFGDGCYNNSFGDGCEINSFGDGCYNNLFGDWCAHNSFGNQCMGNSFGNQCQNIKLNSYYIQNTFDHGVSCVTFDGDGTESNCIQNYHIKQGMVFDGDSEYTITAKPGLNYELSVAKKSDGTVVEYNEADTHKLVSITDNDYASLTTKDSNTLYCIPE